MRAYATRERSTSAAPNRITQHARPNDLEASICWSRSSDSVCLFNRRRVIIQRYLRGTSSRALPVSVSSGKEMFTHFQGSLACPSTHLAKAQIYPQSQASNLSKEQPPQEDDKMAKLLRERSTAQKRRQCKREELVKLSAIIHDLETKHAKLKTKVDGLSEPERQQVLAAQARAGNPPLGCRLCSILDRREEFATLDRLVHHFRVHHTSDLRQRGDDVELQAFATEMPSEDSPDMSDDDGTNDSDEDTPEEVGKSSSVDSLLEMKRKLRLKRNAASARKSRKRKRVQLERWRMMLPVLRYQVETLETALTSVCTARTPYNFDAEPDVVLAAFALIDCSHSAAKTMT